MTTFIPCAFVNSEENPVGYGRILGFNVKSNEQNVSNLSEIELVYSVCEEVHYRHPDAKDEAILVVPQNRILARVRYGDHNFDLIRALYITQQNTVRFVTVAH